MITLDLARLMQVREIESPLKFLVKIGLPYQTAYRLLNGSVSVINYRHLEMLCLALVCTPDDLLNWTPGSGIKNPEQVPLSKLTGRKAKPSITGILKTLPEDKINELHEFASRLAKGDSKKE